MYQEKKHLNCKLHFNKLMTNKTKKNQCNIINNQINL